MSNPEIDNYCVPIEDDLARALLRVLEDFGVHDGTCDCGGSDMCNICNALKVLKRMETK